MFVSVMAFHARISDPVIGGTYMTLLNTITNMAGTWTSTLALWLVDNVSFKDCEGVTDLSLDCDTMQELKVRDSEVCFQGFSQEPGKNLKSGDGFEIKAYLWFFYTFFRPHEREFALERGMVISL